MVSALAADQPYTVRLAPRHVISSRDLQRRLGGFASRIDEEHVAEVGWKKRPERMGRCKCIWMADLEGRRIIELAHRGAHRINNLAPAVSCIHAPQPGGSVEHLSTLWSVIMHAL